MATETVDSRDGWEFAGARDGDDPERMLCNLAAAELDRGPEFNVHVGARDWCPGKVALGVSSGGTKVVALLTAAAARRLAAALAAAAGDG